MWELLEEKDFCDMLFHMRGHHSLCQTMKPKTISQLAAVLAMIRPAKRHLVGKSWDEVMDEVWLVPDNDEYFFKKSHAVGYAMAVKLHMNLLTEQYN
jgi:DNA polymerase III alpha subunit